MQKILLFSAILVHVLRIRVTFTHLNRIELEGSKNFLNKIRTCTAKKEVFEIPRRHIIGML